MPQGRRRPKVFLCKGLDGARHGLNLRSRHPAGGVPPALAARPAVAVPDGGLPSLPPAYFFVSLLFCPHPPAPFPSGEGGDQGYCMQGASPLASPGLGGARHGLNLRSRRPAGAYPRRWWLDQPLRCLTGGLPGGVPAYPAVSLLCFPHPPAPRSQSALPGRKGETKVISCKGLRPLHPRGWTGRGTG